MTSRAQELLREALALAIDDRADVAAELLASLDDAAAERPATIDRIVSAPSVGACARPAKTGLLA